MYIYLFIYRLLCGGREPHGALPALREGRHLSGGEPGGHSNHNNNNQANTYNVIIYIYTYIYIYIYTYV